MTNRHNYGSILFLLIFFVIGAGMMVWGGIVIRNASVSTAWPVTQGEITSSSVDISTDDDGTTYYADIKFKYVVNDRWITADVVNFGEYGSSNPNYAGDIVDKYPVGKVVNVYYNPEKVETAVLEPGLTWSSYFILIMGIIFIIVPTIIFSSMIRSSFSR